MLHIINRDTVRKIQEEAAAALQEVAKRHGLAVQQKGGTIDTTSFLLKFDFSIIGENGDVETREASAFRSFAASYGFAPTDLGRTFINAGERFRLVGFNTNARRMPILGQRLSDGKRFKFVAEGLAARLES